MSDSEVTSPGFRITHVLWSLVLLGWSWLGVETASRAYQLAHPDVTQRQPVFATVEGLSLQIEVAGIVAACLLVLVAAGSLVALSAVFLPRWSFRTSPYTLLATLPAATSPALVEAILPAEDPYTGNGSPLATLMSIVFLTVLATVIALPGLWLISGRVLRPACRRILSCFDNWLERRILHRADSGASAPQTRKAKIIESVPATNGGTVLYDQEFRFALPVADGHEPPHVHVSKGGAEAKWWLQTIAEAYNHGFNRSDRAKIRRIITDHQGFLLDEWRRFFGEAE